MLQYEAWCSIITYHNLVHTIGEVQTPENTYWVKDGSRHHWKEDWPNIQELQCSSMNSWWCTGIWQWGNNIWQNLHEEMECTRKEGIKHDFDKCIIKTKCCSLGNQYTAEGVKSDLKEEAIKQMQPPINKCDIGWHHCPSFSGELMRHICWAWLAWYHFGLL